VPGGAGAGEQEGLREMLVEGVVSTRPVL
jgi:hypothetical protein